MIDTVALLLLAAKKGPEVADELLKEWRAQGGGANREAGVQMIGWARKRFPELIDEARIL